MKRRWLALVMILACSAVIAACFVPDLTLRRELAAARAEGLWTSGEDARIGLHVSPEENAAPAMRRAIAYDRQNRREEDQLNSQSLKLWRQATAFPHLDFERPWGSDEILHPEAGNVSAAHRALLKAAARNIDREANLLAAAHLARLAGEDPGVGPHLQAVAFQLRTLKVARGLGLERKTLQALGPPPSLARALRVELVSTLSIQRMFRKRDGWEKAKRGTHMPWSERLNGIGPFAVWTEAQTLRLYRHLMRDVNRAGGDLLAQHVAFRRYSVPFQKHLSTCTNGIGPFFFYHSSFYLGDPVKELMDARRAAER